jgi:hypothetical protein
MRNAIFGLMLLGFTACGSDEASGSDHPSGTGGAAGESGFVPGVQHSSGDIVITTEGCQGESCGGDLADTTWGYTAGCIDVSALLVPCPQASYDIATTVSGSLAFTADQMTRSLTVTATGTVNVPYVCTLGAIPCDQVAGAWRMFWLFETGNTACVDDGSQGCDCTLDGNYHEETTASYTRDGNTVTTVEGSDTHTYDYCRVGDALTTVETTGSPQPTVYQLTRQ